MKMTTRFSHGIVVSGVGLFLILGEGCDKSSSGGGAGETGGTPGTGGSTGSGGVTGAGGVTGTGGSSTVGTGGRSGGSGGNTAGGSGGSSVVAKKRRARSMIVERGDFSGGRMGAIIVAVQNGREAMLEQFV